MIVAKFGGTSVADATAIGRLAGIVRARAADRPVVVVSALAKVTDALLALGIPVATGDEAAIAAAIDALVERHERTAQALPGATAAIPAIRADAGALRGELLAALGRPLTPAELDAVASRGELWSSRLITAALQGSGLDAVWVDVRPIMRTDDRFTRATPRIDHLQAQAPACFRSLAEGGRIPITQGFIGATEEGVPTTLGRGGSDYTAALLGAALAASRVEIWTDVCGLMTADPRIVPSARTLAEASYDEAAELATFGAKVLHPATAIPLVQAGIPIVVLNSTMPEHPGTLIEPEAELERLGDSPVRSISWKKGITVINIRAPRMLGTYGFLRRLFEVFERHEVVVDVLASSEVSVSLSIEDTSRLDDLVRDLSGLGEVRVSLRRAIVAVVGVGLHTTPGLAGRVFSTVSPVNIEIISQGASAINMTFIVREEDGPDVVRKLHQEFFGSC
jgi:aspartate kinase